MALLALLAGASPAQAVPDLDGDAPGRSEQGGHPTAMATDEQDCWETNTVREASPAAVQAALPDGWLPRRNPAGAAIVVLVDYVCEDFSIDGLPGRRTIVSWLVALTQHAATRERRSWTLAHGSDNPLYVQRLRKLGVDSRYLPRSTATIEPVDATTSSFEMRFVDDGEGPGLDYVRTGTAPEPAGEPATSPGGVFWFATADGGALRIAYTNTVQPATTPTLTETFAPDSIPAAFGLRDVSGSRIAGFYVFWRGSWTADLVTASAS